MVKKVVGLSYCGNQLGHLMGLRCHVSPQDSRNCPALSRRPETCMSNPYPHHFNRYGKAFTDHLFGVPGRPATRQRAFETLCSTLGIDPRLPHQDRRKPMARLSGSTALSRTCCKDSMFDQAISWGWRCTAKSGFTTTRLHNQLWAAKRPCKPWNNGTKSNRQLFDK